MSILDPSPRACVALLLAIPLVVCAGAGLARRASSDVETRRIIAPGAAFALWLLAVYAIGRAKHGFLTGLVNGTVLCALLGVPHALRLWRERHHGTPFRTRWPIAIFVTLCLLAILPAVLCYFHDELLTGGHQATVSQLQNGYFPPRFQI